MPVKLKDLVQLHDAARQRNRDRAFDTDQVRWHGANGKQGGWVVMHPEPRDGTTERPKHPFWIWPVVFIEGSIDHLRLLIQNTKDPYDWKQWQYVANDVHLAYGNKVPDLVEHLMGAIHPLPKGGVLDGFDPVLHLKAVVVEMGKRSPWFRVGMSLQLHEGSDSFGLYAFEIHGEILYCNRHDLRNLCHDAFLRDVLMANGPEWTSC